MVSKNTAASSGEKWEIACAKEEAKKVLGIWAYKDDYAKPDALEGCRTIAWSWQGIADFIDSL